MLSVRWYKVLREVWSHKLRTALVVLSIGVGVFGVGLMATSHFILLQAMDRAYLATHPAHAELKTDPFDHDLVRAVSRIPGVVDVEGRATVTMRLLEADKEYTLGLAVVADYNHIRINQIQPLSGDWPPPPHQLLLERRSLEFLGLRVGDTLLVEDRDGKQRRLRVAGVVYDLNTPIPALTYIISGYISRDTQEWLDGTCQFTQLNLRVAAPDNLDTTWEKTEQAAAIVKRSDRQVYSAFAPAPGSHPIDNVLNRMLLLLGGLALLTLILSGFLVVNIISAVLTEQVRQIGLMKAMGARSHQLVEMYLGMVLIFALLALLLAMPLGVWASYTFSCVLAYSLNVEVVEFNLPPLALALQVGVGLAVPLLAALYPVLKGTRLTPYQALNDYGLSQGQVGQSRLERLARSPRLNGLPRPMLLALRNTFRRKGRLAFTVLTLTIASIVFVGVLGVRASLVRTFDLALSCWQYDLDLGFSRSYRLPQIQRQAMSLPGIVAIEGWNFRQMRRLRPDSSLSREITLIALPATTTMFKPILIEGRWLQPADGNSLVINSDVLKTNPDLKVGDEIQLKFETERPTRWRVVGITMGVITGPMVFANQPYFAHLTHTLNRTETIQVMIAYPSGTGQAEGAAHTDAGFQTRMTQTLETRLEQAGVRVASTTIYADRRSRFIFLLDIFMGILAAASLLLAVVGALGLTATMSLNVMERTREIGVMRAIGATNGAIQQIVLTEGIFIGVLSWGCGALLAWPLGQIVTWLAGTYLLNTPLQYAFSTSGALGWLVIVVLLAALASYLPARTASRLTVREVLAYE